MKSLMNVLSVGATLGSLLLSAKSAGQLEVIPPIKSYRKTKRGVLLGLALLIATCTSLHATTTLPMALPDLCALSERIVLGMVIDKYCEWDADSTLIFTTYTISISQQLKAEDKKTILKVSLPSGMVDSMSIWVSGVPKLQRGDNVLLFVNRKGFGESTIEGWIQGVYFINHSATGSGSIVDYFHRPVVDKDFGNGETFLAGYQDPNESESLSPASARSATSISNATLTLDQFLSLIEAAISQQKTSGYHGRFAKYSEQLQQFNQAKGK